MALTPVQRQHLKALAHHKKPVVQIGGNGVTDGVLGAVEQALKDHELIKVQLPRDTEDKKSMAADVAERTEAELCQVVGRIAVLYRAGPPDKRNRIELPK